MMTSSGGLDNLSIPRSLDGGSSQQGIPFFDDPRGLRDLRSECINGFNLSPIADSDSSRVEKALGLIQVIWDRVIGGSHNEDVRRLSSAGEFRRRNGEFGPNGDGYDLVEETFVNIFFESRRDCSATRIEYLSEILNIARENPDYSFEDVRRTFLFNRARESDFPQQYIQSLEDCFVSSLRELADDNTAFNEKDELDESFWDRLKLGTFTSDDLLLLMRSTDLGDPSRFKSMSQALNLELPSVEASMVLGRILGQVERLDYQGLANLIFDYGLAFEDPRIIDQLQNLGLEVATNYDPHVYALLRPFVVQVVERVNLGNAVEFAEAGHKDDCHRGLILRLHRRFKDMLMDVVRALRERGQSGNINWSEQRQWLDDSASKAVQNHEHLVVKEALVSDVTEGVMGLSTDFLELLRNIAYAEVSLDEYRSVDALRLVIANLLGDAGRRSFIGEENPLSRVSWDRSDYEDGARNVLSVTIAHVLRNLDSQDLIQMQRYYSGIDLGRRLAGGEIDLSPFVEEEVEDLYTDYLRLSRSSQSSRVIFEGGDFEETELTQLIGVLNDQELRFERDEVDKHFVQGVAVGLYLEAALGGNFDFNTTFRGAFDSDISRLVDLDRFPIDQIICDLIIRSLLTLRVRGQRLSSETDGIDRDYVRDRLALSSDQVFPGITR